MDVRDLTPEQVEKAKTCTTPEELVRLAKAEGVELSDEELEVASGGDWGCAHLCFSNTQFN